MKKKLLFIIVSFISIFFFSSNNFILKFRNIPLLENEKYIIEHEKKKLEKRFVFYDGKVVLLYYKGKLFDQKAHIYYIIFKKKFIRGVYNKFYIESEDGYYFVSKLINGLVKKYKIQPKMIKKDAFFRNMKELFAGLKEKSPIIDTILEIKFNKDYRIQITIKSETSMKFIGYIISISYDYIPGVKEYFKFLSEQEKKNADTEGL